MRKVAIVALAWLSGAAVLGACGEGPSAETRFSQLQKDAAQGSTYAQYRLGSMYENGEGVPKDAAKSVEWYQKAAAQGNPNAQYALERANKAMELQKAAPAGEQFGKHKTPALR